MNSASDKPLCGACFGSSADADFQNCSHAQEWLIFLIIYLQTLVYMQYSMVLYNKMARIHIIRKIIIHSRNVTCS